MRTRSHYTLTVAHYLDRRPDLNRVNAPAFKEIRRRAEYIARELTLPSYDPRVHLRALAEVIGPIHKTRRLTFIQIVHGSYPGHLYGLTRQGRVWKWTGSDWEPISDLSTWRG